MLIRLKSLEKISNRKISINILDVCNMVLDSSHLSRTCKTWFNKIQFIWNYFHDMYKTIYHITNDTQLITVNIHENSYILFMTQ